MLISHSLFPTEAGFSCEDGDVRLLNGKSMYEGRVEVCRNNKFSTICSDGWGTEEAMVVCNQLEFTEGGRKLRDKKKRYCTCVYVVTAS